MNRYRYLLKTVLREWLMLLRRPSLLMTLVGIVAVYPLVISALYEKDTAVERPTVVIDADNSELSRRFTRWLDATQGVDVVERLDSVEDGWDRVRERSAELLVVVPEGFAKSVQRGELTKVSAWVDGANMLTYAVAWPALFEVTSQLNAEIGVRFFWAQGLTSDAAKQRTAPLSLDARPLFHPTASYGDFLVTGVLLIILQQMLLVGLAVSAGLSREAGRGPDPRYPFTWLEGKALGQLFVYAAGATVIVYVVMPLFGWSVVASGTAVLVLLMMVLATMPLALLAAHFTRDRYAAFQTLMFVSTPLYLISGFTFPLEHMPQVVQNIAALFPATPALLALRVVAMKTASLDVIAPYAQWMGVQFAVYLVLAIVIVRLTTRSMRKKSVA